MPSLQRLLLHDQPKRNISPYPFKSQITLSIFFPGAFLIPYFLCLAIAGIPIFFIELGIGQRLRRGSVACWNEISPYLGGIGIGCMVVSFLVGVYYNMIIGWSFYYMFISMQEKLPFETCDSYPRITPGKKTIGWDIEIKMTVLASSKVDLLRYKVSIYLWRSNFLSTTYTILILCDV